MIRKQARALKILLRLSLLLNLGLLPAVFLKDQIVYFIRHSRVHDWITQPIMNSSIYKYFYQVDVTPSEKILKLYQLMKDVHEVFEKRKLQYWIESGTLLGAVRHKGIIPWDGDIDISISLDDAYRFQLLIPEFEKLGYEVDEAYFGFKIYLIENTRNRHYNVCCDIFVTAQDNEKILYYSPGARERWKYYFVEKDLFPLKKYAFGEIEVWGPQNPEPYLTMQYGNWQTIAYKGADHLVEGPGSRVPFTLTEKDREPAQPVGPLKERVN